MLTLLSAGFGDTTASELSYAQSRIANMETQLAQMRSAASDNNALLIELAQMLGLRGGITREALLRAAKKRKASK